MNKGARTGWAVGVGSALAWALSTTQGTWAMAYLHVHQCGPTHQGAGCALASGVAFMWAAAGLLALPVLALALSWLVHRWLSQASSKRPSRPDGLLLTCLGLGALACLAVLGFAVACTLAAVSVMGVVNLLIGLAFGAAALALWHGAPSGQSLALAALSVSILLVAINLPTGPGVNAFSALAIVYLTAKVAMLLYLLLAPTGSRAAPVVT